MVDGGCILALDIAKRTGVARGIAGSMPILTTENFARPDDDDVDVFGRLTLWIARLLRDDPPALIAVERPIPLYDSTMLYGMRGIVLGLARAKAVPILQVSIASWRKFFLGTSRFKGGGVEAKRCCVETCARLRWSLPLVRGVPDHNAAEAAGLWLHACSQLAPKDATRCEPLFLDVGAT